MASKELLHRLAALEALVTTTGLDLSDAEKQALTALLPYGDALPTLAVFQSDHPDIPSSVAAETLKHWAEVIELMNS